MQVQASEMEKKEADSSRVYFSNGFNDRAVGSNLNKTWRLMLRVKSTYNEGTNKRTNKKTSFNWDLIEISFFGRFIIKKRFAFVMSRSELSCKAFRVGFASLFLTISCSIRRVESDMTKIFNYEQRRRRWLKKTVREWKLNFDNVVKFPV